MIKRILSGIIRVCPRKLKTLFIGLILLNIACQLAMMVSHHVVNNDTPILNNLSRLLLNHERLPPPPPPPPPPMEGKDVIVYLAQFGRHSTYGTNDGVKKLNSSLEALYVNYVREFPCDVIVFHTEKDSERPAVESGPEAESKTLLRGGRRRRRLLDETVMIGNSTNKESSIAKRKRQQKIRDWRLAHAKPPKNRTTYDDGPTEPIQDTFDILQQNRPWLQFQHLPSEMWELPYGLKEQNHKKWKRPSFSIGYRHMIRFYAILLWGHLSKMGYTHVMRMDDDSYIHSQITYNVFDRMRRGNKRYGFRQPYREGVRWGWGYHEITDRFLAEHPAASTPALVDAYNKSREVAFYNNWFVAEVSFFTSPPVSTFLRLVDESKLIYTKRIGDIVIHSTAVRLFLESSEIQWFRDFTYEHTSRCGVEFCGIGCPSAGGISRGVGQSDAAWKSVVQRFKSTFNVNCSIATKDYFVGPHASIYFSEVPGSNFMNVIGNKLLANDNTTVSEYGSYQKNSYGGNHSAHDEGV